MYLQTISIKNFRCFDSQGLQVELNPGVNVILGENNSGKSSFVDALRLALGLGSGRKDIYIASHDFHLYENGIYADEISVDLIFADLKEDEEATYFELIDWKTNTVQLHIRLNKVSKNGLERIRTKVWGGVNEGQPIKYETLELLNHIFLGALRDAENDLRPGRGSRVGQFLRKTINDEDDKKRIRNFALDANRKILEEDQILDSTTVINKHLLGMEQRRLRQKIELGLVSPEFDRIADSFQVFIPKSEGKVTVSVKNEEWEKLLSKYDDKRHFFTEIPKEINGYMVLNLLEISKNDIGEELYTELRDHIVTNFELYQNGLGYNNLIYIATILGDLQARKQLESYTYNALIIEEPEAHLHPQLQDLLFEFFIRVSQEITDDGIPDNAMQVFITTHSPTLTSQANIDNIIILHKDMEARVVVTSLNKCPLTTEEKEDLKRYLDVTKSQLFYAKGVLLVEGISESLLLPVFSKYLQRPLKQNAVEVVNIGGVAFSPFAKLFNSSDESKRLNVPCAIITDDDRCTEKTDPQRLTTDDLKVRKSNGKEILEKFKTGKISSRANNATELEGGILKVKTAYKTFEYELAKNSQNAIVMLEVLKPIHPNYAKWIEEKIEDDNITPEEIGVYMWKAIRDTKGVFAQRLAAKLDEFDRDGKAKVDFIVPEYIKGVIKYVAPVSSSSDGEKEGDDEDE